MPEPLNSDLWVDRYGDMLYRYTLVRVKNPDSAEEIVQVTLLAALQSKGPIAEKKVSTVPKILKSGAQPSRSDKTRVQYDALRTRIKKSGGKDHAAVEELIRSRLGA